MSPIARSFRSCARRFDIATFQTPRLQSTAYAHAERDHLAEMAEIQLHNTLTGKIEAFVPQKAGEVRMYTCGPTVYSYAHIGNYRTFVFQDILRRFLKLRGFKLHHVMNLTDVDDRIIANAAAAGKNIRNYTEKFVRAFFDDCKALSIETPEHWIRATDHIGDMVKLIQRLQEKTFTYSTEGSIYYRIAKFPGYGKLSKIDVSGIQDGARVDNDRYEKESARDFALWKAPKPGEHFWETALGPGRPGWHIECSAMAMKYLGETLDIHTGGIDLAFPHHENEIAQSEAATGKPFVRYWLHAEHLLVEDEKMSKSKGGFYTLDDVISWGYDPLAFRLLALGAGYRNGLDFTREGMNAAQSRLERWRRTVAAAYAATKGRVAEPEGEHVITREFRDALADDLNTPKALAAAEKALALAAMPDSDEQERALWMLFDMDRVLGLSLRTAAAAKDELTPDERALFEQREAARKSGDYTKSDALRKELLQRFGIQVKDTKDGTRWERVGRKGA